MMTQQMPRRAGRVRAPASQARTLPIPDYPAFAAVANQHRSRWEITYEDGKYPYQARSRVTGEYIAASTLDLLDLLLTIYEPPSYARAYADQAAF